MPACSKPFHHHEGQAIRQAPILITAAPVQIYSSTIDLGLERDNLDLAVTVNSAMILGSDSPRRCVGESIEPLPEDGLGSHYLASRPYHGGVPRHGLGVVLISFAGKRNPE